ncbi:LuxR C-terminal-related transcriptional regulator [Mycolicibacterium sp.]|uniref:helix-turn-helix transcriptional regulator n=1 Tax=Mycolicibacterium sp. TaxID=2320850 RepID=UPI003D11258F
MRLSWPLSGRGQQVGAIEAALAAPDVAGIVVHGPAGVGKSRTVRDTLAAERARGRVCHWTVCSPSAQGLPLGAFAAWAPPGDANPLGLLRGVIDALTAGDDAILGVDDAHLLDDLSAFVVHQIAQRGLAHVVLTVRDGEPLPAAVRDITKAGRFDRLDLEPLSPAETTALLSATLRGVIDPDAARRLWALTRGNPLYLRTIVEQEVADGRLDDRHGCWQWTGDPAMPPSLVELIEARFGQLGAGVDDVVDALAVGEPIGLPMLQRITDPAAVEEAETRGLITVEPSGSEVRLAHPLYGEVRRRRAPATKLRRLRGLVATELAGSGDDDLQLVVRRAALSLDSDLAADAGLLVRAARGALWLADLPLAERLAAAAVRSGAGPEANFLRSHALSWFGRGQEADAVLVALPAADLGDDDRGRLAFLRASNLLWALGDAAAAKASIDAAAGDCSPRTRTYLDAFRTVYWFAMDEPQQTAAAGAALVLAELPAVVGAEVAWVLTAVAADAGRTAEAVTVAETGYAATARALDNPHMRFNIADAHITALLLAGRIGDAVEVAEHARQQAADLPGAAQALGAAVTGRAALGAGQLGTACELLELAAESLSSAYADSFGYRYQVPRITALAMRGATGQAASLLAGLDRVHRRFRALDYELGLARAWLAANQGVVSEAIAVLLGAAHRAATHGQVAVEVHCLQIAAQFGDRTGAARLGELAATVSGERVGVAHRFAEALHCHDGDELSRCSEEFEQLGDLVAAADAAAHAALAFRCRDLRGSALRCSARASALAERCGVTSPALRQALEPVPLTDREAEIVMLIAEGLSNRAVAERLTLSVRTVESHIYRAMTKTGTTTRAELAAVLHRPGGR